jgi:type II secretory pathway component PulK
MFEKPGFGGSASNPISANETNTEVIAAKLSGLMGASQTKTVLLKRRKAA